METFDLVIKGNIVLENEVTRGEIGVSHGKIAAISPQQGVYQAAEGLDFEQAYVYPGAIDAHVHCFSNPDEGIVPTSSSAAVGGVTTFIDMPYDLPVPINRVSEFKQKIQRVEQEAVVDMGLWATIAKTGGTDQIKLLAEAGAMAFKMSTFETDEYRFPRIPDAEIMRAMKLINETGLTAAFHAENDDIIFDMIDEYQQAGKVYARAHAETRPAVTETSAVLKLLEFAYWTDVKLHIVHVSHPRTIELIKAFKQQGVNVTAETCYPYLLLTVSDLDKYGPKAKMNPPLRQPQEVEAMWKHLEQGNIDLITSDHAPWGLHQKIVGQDNIFLAASGLPGVEILAPLIHDAAVASDRISPLEYAKLMAQHPAEVFQIRDKGKIALGYDADFMVIDPTVSWEIDETQFQSASKLSPFHGKKLRGKIIQTIVRGTTVYNGKEVTVSPGYGKFIPGSAYKK